MSKNIPNRFCLLSFFLCFCSLLFSQPSTQTFNPYSRYGIGELENKGYTQSAAMGRSFAAFENDERDSISPVFTNPGNPASYASLRLTSFEVGGKSYFNFLTAGNEKIFKNNSYLSYLSLAFPLGKRSGFCAGVSPYSNVGYKISDVNEVSGIGSVQTIYEGTGGVNQVFAGLGYRPFQARYTRFLKSHFYDSLRKAGNWELIRKKRFWKSTLSSVALGANAHFLFGDLDNKTSVIYPTSGNYFNTRRIRSTRVNDLYLNYGALFSFRVDSTFKRRACQISDTSKYGYHIEYLKNCPCTDSVGKEKCNELYPRKFQKRSEFKITLGASVSLPSALRADYSALGYTYKPTFLPNVDNIYDTTLNVTEKGTITMPVIMNFGVGIRKGTKLTILADVSIQNWSYYRFFGDDPKLKNSMRYSLGFQYVSNAEAKTKRDLFREKTMYRAGLYYNTGQLDLKNTLITEYGVSIGAGIPLGSSWWNQASIAVEFGRFGTTEKNLIRNNYIRCTLGLTLNQKWFVKRTID